MGGSLVAMAAAVAVAAARRGRLGVSHPLKRPLMNPHAALGYAALGLMSLQACSGLARVGVPRATLFERRSSGAS